MITLTDNRIRHLCPYCATETIKNYVPSQRDDYRMFYSAYFYVKCDACSRYYFLSIDVTIDIEE